MTLFLFAGSDLCSTAVKKLCSWWCFDIASDL